MAQLNNSNAYGFCKNIVANAFIKSMKALHPTMKCEQCVSKNNTFKPIDVKLGKLKVSVLAGNVHNDILPLSMYHMMNCPHIGFIWDGKIYIISRESLQGNWNEIMSKNPYKYTDGLGVTAQMTPADVNKLMTIAEHVYEVPEDIYTWYESKKQEYFD